MGFLLLFLYCCCFHFRENLERQVSALQLEVRNNKIEIREKDFEIAKLKDDNRKLRLRNAELENHSNNSSPNKSGNQVI